MSGAFWRHVARLHLLSLAPRRELLQAQRLHSPPGQLASDPGEEEEKGREEGLLLRPQEAAFSRGYTLFYNPSSYRRLWPSSGASLSRAEQEEEESNLPAPLTPPFRQQGNRYSLCSSRRFSSTKNIRLDLAVSRTSHGTKGEAEPGRTPDPSAPDVLVDPRAFQRCRPEYSSMTLDLSTRPPPCQSQQAFDLLHKVTVLKGQMEPQDVTGFLVELGCVQPEQALLVRADTRFVMLLRYAVDNLHHFSHAQLLDALAAFVWLDLPATHSVLGQYEAQLARRAADMSLHQLLLAADMWRLLGRPVPRYLERMYDRVGELLSQVGVAELAQLLYVIGEGRGCPEELLQPVERLVTKHLKHLAPEEVGAVCLGLFKSKTSLSGTTVSLLVDRAWSQAADMSDFALVNVLKLLRFSHLDHRAWLEVTAREVPRRAPGMGVQGLMHVALACSALHYRDDQILDAVAKRLPSLAPHCRSKDAAKLLWAFGSLGVSPAHYPDLYPSLTEALRQKEAEFQRYPEHFLTGLLGLAFACQLPEDLLASALSPEFVILASSSKHLLLKKDLVTLDGVAALEFPDWAGPRLTWELREEVTEMLWSYAQQTVCQKAEVLDAERALRDLLGGEEFVRKCMILPHTRSIDLEVHLDPTGQPIPVTSATGYPTSSLEGSVSSSSYGSWERVNRGVTLTGDLLAQLTNAKKTPDPRSVTSDPASLTLRRTKPDKWGWPRVGELDLTDGLVRALTKPGRPRKLPRDASAPRAPAVVKLAIQVSNRNHYCYRSQQLLGFHAMKRRQLALAGYRVVELAHWEWFPLLRKSLPEKLAYLHCKVFSTD